MVVPGAAAGGAAAAGALGAPTWGAAAGGPLGATAAGAEGAGATTAGGLGGVGTRTGVLLTATTALVTDPTGQFVTLAGQAVTVDETVAKTVDRETKPLVVMTCVLEVTEPTGQLVMVGAQEVMVKDEVSVRVEVTSVAGAEVGRTEVAVAVALAGLEDTGQTVVPMTMVSVVTWPMLAGQLVTVGAQLVIV